jgi:type IV secretion system protein VirD4
MIRLLDEWLTAILQDMEPQKRDTLLWSLTALLLIILMVWFSASFILRASSTVISTLGGYTAMGSLTGPCIVGVLFLCLCFLFGFTVRLAISKQSSPTRSTFGSAHFATLAEVEAAHLIPRKEQARYESYLYLGAFLAQKPRARAPLVALSQRQQEAHVLVVAPTGRGKTAGVIIPNLLLEAGKRSLFINDTKGELVDKCAGNLERDHICLVFSPTRPSKSHHYNPLAHIDSMDDAEDLAAAIVHNTGESNEQFWNNAAQLLITAAILHIKAATPNAPFSAFVQFLCGSSLQDVKTTLLASPSMQARAVATSFINALGLNERLSGSIMVELATRLFSMTNTNISDFTADDDIDFSEFIARPTAVFLSIPASDAKRLRWLSSCLIMQLMKFLTKQAESMGGRLQRPAALYLDEFGNSYIPHYPEYISLVRSAGIALLMTIQGFGQLEQTYGAEGKETILANATTHIIFSGMGMTECNYYSERLGESTVQVHSSSVTGITQTATQSHAQRRLMYPDELRRMQDGQLIVLSENVSPVQVHNVPYFLQDYLVGMIRPYTLPIRPVQIPPAFVPAPQPQPPQQFFMP